MPADIRAVSLSANTDVNGQAILSIKIPGDFILGQVSRWILDARVWFDSSGNGDKIISLVAKDIDAVVPVQNRALFPSYPILGSWIDIEADQALQQIYLNPNGPTEFNNPKYDFRGLPGSIYLQCTAQYRVATPITPVKFYGLIRWVKEV